MGNVPGSICEAAAALFCDASLIFHERARCHRCHLSSLDLRLSIPRRNPGKALTACFARGGNLRSGGIGGFGMTGRRSRLGSVVGAALLSTFLSGCGGGSGSTEDAPIAPPPNSGGQPPAEIVGVATPSSVSVVTATNAN